MKCQFEKLHIPIGTVLGINYSGFHDSAITLMAPNGEVLFACALERVTRVKQDGRPPVELLKGIPWDKISQIAVSTDENLWSPTETRSKIHPTPLKEPRSEGIAHQAQFKEFFHCLPKPKVFVCHQLSHAHSAFWPSGFEEAVCFTYDGGMFNSPWFGGMYQASKRDGIKSVDLFHMGYYGKITSLYSVVTGLVGFTPNKHEGKITGLAAYGKPTTRCREILTRLYLDNYLTLESCLEWLHSYSSEKSPTLNVHGGRRQLVMKELQGISREEIAATVQQMAEDHVIQILDNAKKNGLLNSENICLAGGLFANVKINQRVKEFGFKRVFIAPAMTDDGTAWGAAFAVVSKNPEFSSKSIHNVFFGHRYEASEIETVLKKHSIHYNKIETIPKKLAGLLAEGKVVGVFQGGMEFGPRALGNRSILGQATRADINQSLNDRLCRTEFMPFAPMTRVEDVKDCYPALAGDEHTAEFMTITCDCSEVMKKNSPAVVHVDGTARPQLVDSVKHPLIHAVLTEYEKLTGYSSIINTSFNIHEEPIVCTPYDALQGFLEAGLDYLVFSDAHILISFQDNLAAAVHFLQSKRRQPSQKAGTLGEVNDLLWNRLSQFELSLAEKEAEIKGLHKVCKERADLIDELDTELKRQKKVLVQCPPSLGWKQQVKNGIKKWVKI